MDNYNTKYLDAASINKVDSDNLDYSILDRHIAEISSSGILSRSAVKIYDNYMLRTVFETDMLKKWLGDNNEEFPELYVHPYDLDNVWKCGIAAMKHVFNNVENCGHIKFVRNFRAMICGQYRKVTEQYYVLYNFKNGLFLGLDLSNGVSQVLDKKHNVTLGLTAGVRF